MSIEVPGDPPKVSPSLWIHTLTGQLYEMVGYGYRAGTQEVEIQYWAGDRVWHRSLLEFDKKFVFLDVL